MVCVKPRAQNARTVESSSAREGEVVMSPTERKNNHHRLSTYYTGTDTNNPPHANEFGPWIQAESTDSAVVPNPTGDNQIRSKLVFLCIRQ